MTQTVRLEVEGMTCAACASRIERVLGKQDGVSEAVINYATGDARVVFDPTLTEIEELADAVDRIGYGITPAAERRTPRDEVRSALGVLALAIVGTVIVVAGFNQILTVAAASVVTFIAGWQFHREAVQRARYRSTNMDTLISLGSGAAYGYSVWAVAAGEEPYFHTAAFIITFVLAGRYLEARAKGRASQAVTKLLSLGAKQATVRRGDELLAISADDIAVGDELVVAPGEIVPADGVVIEGSSEVDEALMTGESIPVVKTVGDEVFGATVNQQGRLIVEATAVGRNSSLGRIARMVEDAQATKADIQRLADRVSSVFVPSVLGLSLVTLVGWMIAGRGFGEALALAIAVLVVACPCALGLATPMAVMVGTGRGAELGVLFKQADVFERVQEVDTVIFDKTGTLTAGAMEFRAMHSAIDEARFLQLVASAESGSTHPIATAIVNEAERREIELHVVTALTNHAGLGIEAEVDFTQLWVGTSDLMAREGLKMPEIYETVSASLEQAGSSVFFAGWYDEVKGLIAVADQIRPESSEVIAELRSMGVNTAMVTGDSYRVAHSVADAIGIEEVHAGVRPEEKAGQVRELQDRGLAVAFAGDGINDAPALTQADIGMAIGAGSDIAIESGDIVLANSNPLTVATAVDLARRIHRTIRQNLGWAFLYNTAAIPLAIFGFLTPPIAAGAMALSSVSVVLNSLRLIRYDHHYEFPR